MNSNKLNVCILDYGSGNVKSVYNLISSLTDNVKISNNKADIKKATHFILPGVGAFATSMEKIRNTIPLKDLEYEIFDNKKPFLGICIGMHVLASKGFEFGEFDGLNWISGEVKQIESGEHPLPHIGWNNLEEITNNPLFKDITTDQDFYFVHSFAFSPNNENTIIAKTNYGENFTSAIQKDNIWGVQFHPEKSQNTGKLLIKNFLNLTNEEE